jgi:hypothetical protein
VCALDAIVIVLYSYIGLVWLPSFGARIKEFTYDSNNYMFGCYGIGYGIPHFFIPCLTIIPTRYFVIYVDLPK